MSAEPVVSVRGEAQLEVPPELARLWLAVAAQDRQRARVIERLDQRAVALRQVLDGFGEAVERVETTGVNVSPRLKPGKGDEQVVGYAGSVRFTVTVPAGGFGRLAELIVAASAVEQVEVHGPNWELRPTSLWFAVARRRATEDAVARAREYAAALGCQLGELLELADTGLLSGPSAAPRMLGAMSGAAMAMRGKVASDEFTFEIEPPLQSVTAQVEVRCSITPPNLDLVGRTAPG